MISVRRARPAVAAVETVAAGVGDGVSASYFSNVIYPWNVMTNSAYSP